MIRRPSPKVTDVIAGCRVAFRPGSPPYLEGVRTGVVMRAAEPAREFLRRHAAQFAGPEVPSAPAGLELPVIRIDPVPGVVPIGLEIVCRPEHLEVIDEADHRQAN